MKWIPGLITEYPSYYQACTPDSDVPWCAVDQSEVVMTPKGVLGLRSEEGIWSTSIVEFRDVVEPLFFVHVAAAELVRVGKLGYVSDLEEAWEAISTGSHGPAAYRPDDVKLLGHVKELFQMYCPWARGLFQEPVIEYPETIQIGNIFQDVKANHMKLSALGVSISNAYERMETNTDPEYVRMQTGKIKEWLEEMVTIHTNFQLKYDGIS